MHALLVTEHLFLEQALAFCRLLVEEWLDAHPAGFGAEVAAQRICACEAPATAPGAGIGEVAFADEFLLAGVEAFVAFAIVLAGKGFATDGADEGPFVGVGAQMRAEVVGTSEAFGTKGALEGGGVFLYPCAVVTGGCA